MTRRTLLLGLGASLARGATPVVDLHQHTDYSGRTDAELIAHQERLGITRTVLLPAGERDGLAVGAGSNDSVVALTRRYPERFVYFANWRPDAPDTRTVLEKYLRKGAIGIGEQKFPVDCDSPHIDLIASIAREFHVPVLMHFQHETYNFHYERFHRMLEKYPGVNFIGHAQTFWGYIDAKHDPKVLYPKGPVTPGGLTDRWLKEYPNFFGDLSAGSGLNALRRDEEHAHGFLARHQDKLIFGTDCNDRVGEGTACSGSQQLAEVRRLAPDAKALQKILAGNAARVMKLSV